MHKFKRHVLSAAKRVHARRRPRRAWLGVRAHACVPCATPVFTGNSQPTPPFNIARHRSLCRAQLATGKPVFVKSGGVSRQTFETVQFSTRKFSSPNWRRGTLEFGMLSRQFNLDARGRNMDRKPYAPIRCYYRIVEYRVFLSVL